MNIHYYDSVLNQLREMANRYHLSVIDDACNRIEAVRDNFEMKVLFVGHFSAGKSSFLNELIGLPDFLREGADPTTAEIKEIRYSELQQPNLEPIASYTLVDTPGYDSTIGEHTRALSTYLGCGGGYVVMSDIRKGGLDDLMLSYIREVSTYTNNVAVVFSWCDQVSEANAQKILDESRSSLSALGYDFPVLGLSRHDKDLVRKLTELIQGFDIQASFNRQMMAAFSAEKEALKNALILALRHADGGTWSTDNQLNALRLQKEQVTAAFANERKAAEQKFPEEVDAVMDDIHSALVEKADLCADLIVAQDGQALEAVMLEAVRPVLLRHVQQITANQIDSIVHELSFSSVMEASDQKGLESSLMGTVNAVKDLVDSGTLGQALSVLKKEDDEKQKKSEDSNKTYKMITGITALLTDVINPWAEVVIVLLPEIVGLGKALFGASEHEIAREKYLKRIVKVVSAKLYLPVENALRRATTALVEGLSSECTMRLKAFEDEIAQLEDSKGKICLDTVQHREALKLDLQTIEALSFQENCDE